MWCYIKATGAFVALTFQNTIHRVDLYSQRKGFKDTGENKTDPEYSNGYLWIAEMCEESTMRQ